MQRRNFLRSVARMATSPATLFALGFAIIYGITAIVMLKVIGFHYSHFVVTAIIMAWGLLTGAICELGGDDVDIGELTAGGCIVGLTLPLFIGAGYFGKDFYSEAGFLMWTFYVVIAGMCTPFIGYVLINVADELSGKLRREG